MIYGFTNSLVGSGGSASVEQNGQLLMDFKPLMFLEMNGNSGNVPMPNKALTSDFSPSNNLAEDFPSLPTILTYPTEE